MKILFSLNDFLTKTEGLFSEANPIFTLFSLVQVRALFGCLFNNLKAYLLLQLTRVQKTRRLSEKEENASDLYVAVGFTFASD